MKRIASLLAFTFLAGSLIAEPASSIAPGYDFKEVRNVPPPDPKIDYGKRIPRTMHLLATSTAERPNKVKILFYGQSITRQNYSRRIIESKLRSEYPHAQMEVLNPAIGGYQAPRSVHTMFHTLIPEQPDLVVFHVYGGESDGTYEEIIKNIHQFTTAELMVVTHHLDNYDEARTRQKDQASQLRRDLGRKYQSELVEIRGDWRRYLKMHDLTAPDLLKDNVHHNDHGGELWGVLQARHFQAHPADPKEWEERITRIDLASETKGKLGKVVFDPKDWNPTSKGLENGSTGKSLKIEFEGTRVDVIHFGGDGIADIHIDGKSPSEIPETWSATLPSSSPIDYRPAIMRVGLMGLPEKETWTLTAHSVSNNGRTYNYSVKGSVSGFQGKGDQSDIFQSDNGILQIDPRMITFADAIRIRKKPIPTPFNVTWKTINRSLDQWHCKSADEKNPSGQTTLVQQLTNGKHTLEIIPRSGTIQIEQILIHRPDTP